MENNSFKSSLFGGFRRKDVIAYIEKSAAESGERITALEAAEDKLSQENETLRGDLASLTGARDRLSEALHDNYDKQEALKAELDAAQEELGEMRAQLAALSEERDTLRDEVEKLRPQAKEFCSVKANLTELELAAHRRAEDYEAQSKQRVEAFEAEARQRAEEYESGVRARADGYEAQAKQRAAEYESDVRARLHATVESCRAQCDLVMATLGTTCENVAAELRRGTETVTHLPDAFHTLRHDLEDLEKFE